MDKLGVILTAVPGLKFICIDVAYGDAGVLGSASATFANGGGRRPA